MSTILRTALMTTALCASLGLSASAQEYVSAGHLTHARNLVALETTTGYRLSGQLESTNTCMNTRFARTYRPNVFDAQEYRRRRATPYCGQIVGWKKTTINVVERHVPRYVTVREAGGVTVKVRVIIPFAPIYGPGQPQ